MKIFVKKFFASTLLVAMGLGLVVVPVSASTGGCRCGTALTGGICDTTTSEQECIDFGRSIASSQHVTVTCATFTAVDCSGVPRTYTITAQGEVTSTAVSPTGAPILTTPVGGGTSTTSSGSPPTMGVTQDSTPTFSAEPQKQSTAPPGFPKPTIVIPEINIQIPGLTNFVAPHPGACPPAFASLGIQSCRVFPWIGQYVSAVYNFGFAIAAFLAVVMVMWGGFLYITASGISSQAEQAKTYIQGAFLGLIIVFTSYLMLSTINPDLVKFHGLVVPDVPPKGSVPVLVSLPNATTEFEKGEDIDVDSPTAATSTGAAPRRGTAPKPSEVASPPTAVTAAGAPATPSAALCTYATKNDVVSDATVNDAFCPHLPGANGTYAGVKEAKDQPNGRATDRATPQMIAAIQQLITRINSNPTLAESVGQWQITEGWPPTVHHSSRCHFRGCAIDIKLLGAVTPARIAAMDQVVNQMKTSGIFCYVLNEYTHQVKTTTGGNFHVESYHCPQ